MSNLPDVKVSAIIRVQNGLDSVLMDKALILTVEEREAVSDSIDYLSVLIDIILRGANGGPGLDAET